MNELKLNLGCGADHKAGYINIDLYTECDLRHDLTTPLPYPDNSVDEIYASHIIEHFSRKEWGFVKKDWERVLKPNGKLEIFCPDIDFCVACFLSNRKGAKWEYWLNTIYGSQSEKNPGDFHKNGFTYEKLISDLEGFSRVEKDDSDPSEIHLTCYKNG
jgi:predicted SAM-dependent methyltransferase